MQVVEILNPLEREFKSVGTLRKEFAELPQEKSLTEALQYIVKT
jgi:hypothetical protein